MTTHIVIAGLMLLVPQVDPATKKLELVALVLDTKNAAPQFGHPIQPHETTIRSYNGVEKPLDGTWTINSSDTSKMTFEDDKRMLVLRRVYGGVRLPDVRKACLATNFAVDCRIGGRPLIVAQLRFTGGWRVRPIDINKNRDPDATQDDSWWGFVRQDGGALPVALTLEDKVELSAGVMLTAPEGATVSFEGPYAGSFEDLKPLHEDACAEMTGDKKPCVVVRILNTVTPTKPQVESLEIDHHHSLLYDLFFPSPSPRYLVFLRANGSDVVMDDLYPDGGGSPGIRPCPPPAMLDIPEP